MTVDAATSEGRIPTLNSTPVSSAATGPRVRTRPSLRVAAPALLAYAAVRLVGLLIAALYGSAHQTTMLNRLGSFWDAGWYVRIVQTGYSVGDGFIGNYGIPYSPRAFFPLFPWLADPLNRILGLTPGTALVLVSCLAGLAAAWGVYAVADLVHGRRAGVIAAVLWGVLPLAILENAAYSEALFTAFAAWTLYAVLARNWIWAGALCVLTGLTRPSAMAVTAAVAVAALVELYRIRRGRVTDVHWSRPLLAGLASPLGWGGYMLYVGWTQGSLTGYLHIQKAWNSSFDGGVSTLHWFNQVLLSGQAESLSNVVEALTVIGYLVLFAITLVHRQPVALMVYSACLLVISLGNGSPYPPLARFLLPAFPLLFPLAAALARSRSWWTLWVVLGASALVSGVYGIDVLYLATQP
ncbi:glycosyltransferase family 39 protein [Streptacidiphilus sp. EB129]|uniref:glycosyltransferase family 39 protein n=1 Tax=Streptacidiphilus sp. EB129 TaxID=3156262 RepID=UPI0035159DCF